MGKKEPKVRLIDDDPTVLAAQSTFLRWAGLEVVCYSKATDFLSKDDLAIDGCAVVDIRMPNMTGLELQEEMLKRNIDLPIIFLSAHGDIDMAVKAVKKGAKTFLTKPPELDRLVEEIKEAIAHNIELRKKKKFGRVLIKQWNALTETEKEIASLVAKGLTNQVISEVQEVSEKTVRSQRATVYGKLDVKNAAELAGFLNDLKSFGSL